MASATSRNTKASSRQKAANRQNENEEQTAKQKRKTAARKLLAKADEILAGVDGSYIMKENEGPRQYPTFNHSEVKVGPLLGVGGFCFVFEVQNFELKEEDSERNHDKQAEADGGVGHVRRKSVSIQLPDPEKVDDSEQALSSSTNQSPNDATAATHESHYDVLDARTFMARNARRKGDARYAIKRLAGDLDVLERTRGIIDLALEAKFLSVIWHPNIVKMRGYAEGSMLSPRFFIIMDRLYETLDVKIKQWAKTEKANRGGMFGRGSNKCELDKLLLERLTVAYDLAAAFSYMHQNKVVYRDIKQENIGFDVRGDVKVFDFGLSKSLSDHLRAKDNEGKSAYGYRLTARTGSLPYMAPEVAEAMPYDTKCDVFSFAILLWEILSLKPAFKGYTKREFLDRVVRAHERPSINRKWPALTRLAMKEAWNHDPQKRPDMKRVSGLLRGDLNEMSTDSTVQDRTTHMRNRSAHSHRLPRSTNGLKFKQVSA